MSRQALAAAQEIILRMKATFPEIRSAYDPNWEIPIANIIDRYFQEEVMPSDNTKSRHVAVTGGSPSGERESDTKSCNRHTNCELAVQELLARHPGMKRTDVSFSFHCHDDECEDCFGK
jgi:hypothetical protein